MAKTATVSVRPGTPTKSKPPGKGAPSPAKLKPAPPEKLPSTRRVSFAEDVLPTGGREAPASAPPKPTAPPKSAASPKPPKAPASPKPATAKGKVSDGNSSGSGSSRSKGPGGLQPAPVMPPVPPPLPPEAPAPALSAKPPTHEIASAKPALVRAGEELSSDKVSELPAGTRVTVLETREQPGGATRARVALEGQAQAHGWLTASTKDGSENLRALVAPVAASSTSSSEGGSGSSRSGSGSGSGGGGGGGGSGGGGSSARAASPGKPKSARAASPAKPKPPKGPPAVNGSVKPKGKEKEAPEAAPADKRPPKPPPPPPPPRQRGFEDLSDTQEEALIGLMFDDFVVAHRMKSLDYDKVRRFAMTIQQDPAVCSTLATPPLPGDELVWVPSDDWITDKCLTFKRHEEEKREAARLAAQERVKEAISKPGTEAAAAAAKLKAAAAAKKELEEKQALEQKMLEEKLKSTPLKKASASSAPRRAASPKGATPIARAPTPVPVA